MLVTTLTKKMAEDLTDYLLELGIRARYLHSEVDTLRRVELLRELRLGEYDVLVGINLLREGLDLPEVSLVAILDADKEGFLRSGTSLIQTIGRAARNVSGQVHMYADKVTPSMQRAIDETNRRRDRQIAYNTERGVDPQPLRKRIADILDQLPARMPTPSSCSAGLAGSRAEARHRCRACRPGPGQPPWRPDRATRRSGWRPGRADLAALIAELTEQMHAAAAELQFEIAARIRDEVRDLKHELRGMQAAGSSGTHAPTALLEQGQDAGAGSGWSTVRTLEQGHAAGAGSCCWSRVMLPEQGHAAGAGSGWTSGVTHEESDQGPAGGLAGSTI